MNDIIISMAIGAAHISLLLQLDNVNGFEQDFVISTITHWIYHSFASSRSLTMLTEIKSFNRQSTETGHSTTGLLP